VKKVVADFFCGLAFGITQIVPGVSGGTVAIVLGFYFRLVKAVNHFGENRREHLLFLAPLLLGTAAGLVLFSSLVSHLLERHAFPTMLFFIGLILGVVPHVFSKVREGGEKIGAREIALFLLPFPLLLAMSSLRGDGLADPAEVIAGMGFPLMLFLFFAGILAAAALVIPGVSGSFMLLLLGVYPLVVFSVSSIRLWLIDVANVALLLDILRVLGPFALGALAGVLSTLRLVEKLLEKRQKPVYAAITGLMLASALVIFIGPEVRGSEASAPAVVAGLAALCLGCVAAFLLGRKRL